MYMQFVHVSVLAKHARTVYDHNTSLNNNYKHSIFRADEKNLCAVFEKYRAKFEMQILKQLVSSSLQQV